MANTAFALPVRVTVGPPRPAAVGTCGFCPRVGLRGAPPPPPGPPRGRRGRVGAAPAATPGTRRAPSAAPVGGAAMAADDAPTRHVLVPIADGSEEMEAVTIVDTLVRAGAAVTLASVSPSTTVTCSRGVRLVADAPLEEVPTPDGGWDLIALPGGMPGASTLAASPRLAELLRQQKAAGRWIGAICAAPAVVLAPLGLLDGGEAATCYPSADFLGALPNPVEDAFVVSDGRLVTSQGPGTALLFSLCCVEKLYGKVAAEGQAAVMCEDPDEEWGWTPPGKNNQADGIAV